MKITKSNQDILLKHARLAIENHLNSTEYNYQIPEATILSETHGVFISIFVDGKLRGSLGYVDSEQCIMESVAELATAVVEGNDRFPKLEKFELPYLKIQINILSALKQIFDKSKIQLGVHGLYVNHPDGEGLLFPHEAVERDYDKIIFLNEVCHKAGLASFTWEDDDCQVYIFDNIVFSDSISY